MIKINVSRPDNYYSQRNNEIRGSVACNVTSAAAFLSITEEKAPFTPQGMSLDDFLMATLIGKEGYDILFETNPSFYPDYTPNEVHDCLCWAINRVNEKQTAIFKTTWDLKEILFSIVKGKPVIMSGKFNGLHHVILLVGIVTSQYSIRTIRKPSDIDISKISNFIIDDPWGDPNTNYTSHSGDDIVLTKDDFMEQLKPLHDENIKWGHLHIDIVNMLRHS